MTLNGSATLIDDRMKFACTAGDHINMTDYPPPFGNGEGPTSLEMFLASLCSCLGGTLAAMLRQGGKTVTGLTVYADGNRRDTHPTCFDMISLQVRVESADVTQQDLNTALSLAQDRFCPVAAMLRGNVSLQIAAAVVPA